MCLPRDSATANQKNKGTEKQEITAHINKVRNGQCQQEKQYRKKQSQELRDISRLGQTVVHTSAPKGVTT